MEKGGYRSVIAFSARGSFRSTDVNLTIPRRGIDGVCIADLGTDVSLRLGKLLRPTHELF
jgi:hypothetical protein